MFNRLRHDPRTQAYYERRTQEGKTRREILRCLKRYAAREVFNLVRPASGPVGAPASGCAGRAGRRMSTFASMGQDTSALNVIVTRRRSVIRWGG